MNSSTSNGMSKWLELKPAMSQLWKVFAKSLAFSLNDGQSATSSS